MFKSTGCDLYNGEWYYDSEGPLYTNNTCPILSQTQNCQGNGRPDKEYENWRWRPFNCELPKFNATKFLELMSGKTITFVGDSVARNQMESLLCILWQVNSYSLDQSTLFSFTKLLNFVLGTYKFWRNSILYQA